MSYLLRGFGDAPFLTSQVPGASMEVTPETAQSIAAKVGGTVINRVWGQTDIQLPNGQVVNAGALASVYNNPLWKGNPGIQNAEAEKILNSDVCITEWGNVVSDCHTSTPGAYTVKGSQITYDPNAAHPAQPQAPVLSQSQYQAWQQRNASVTPKLTAPIVTSSNSASSAPASPVQSIVDAGSKAVSSFSIPWWGWLAAAGGALFFFGRGR